MDSLPPLPPIFDQRPRERLRRLGLDALSDAELLALVLGTGRPDEPAVALAARVLEAFGGARGLLRAGTGELAEFVGIARAARVVGAVEITRRALSAPLEARLPYNSSHDVARAYGPRLADRADERAYAIMLDARNRPVAERLIAQGDPTSCALGARGLFALAMREGAASVLLVHNHPSGDPTPSLDDMRFTRRLVEAGEVLGLPVVDHVIVGREGTFSFLDAGLLRTNKSAKESTC